MTLNELSEMARTCNVPTGDRFLDGIYDADRSAVYYRFLYALVQKTRPALTVELGTYNGWSTAHLAGGNPNGRVVTIDIGPQEPFKEVQPRFKNIGPIKGSSTDPGILSRIEDCSVDICFFDSLHEKSHVVNEVNLWTSKIRSRGILLFDDVNLDDGMKEFWGWLPLEKTLLPGLHWTGFGAAVKV